MIKISLDTKSLSQAIKLIEKTAKHAEKGLAQSSMHAAAIIRKNMVDSMPQASGGKVVKRWTKDSGMIVEEIRRHSMPGQPPFKQSGKLAKSIRFEEEGKGARIFSAYQGRGIRKNNDFIARIMETGTVKMKPRPFTQRAVSKSLSRLPLLMRTEIINKI